MNKYKVVDTYEGFDLIGYANTLKEVKQLAKQQYEDCDGECSICYYPLNEKTQKYDRSKIKFLETF